MHIKSVFLILLTSACYAGAEVSLYIPAFVPEAIVADEIGVGSDGATTWWIAPAETTAIPEYAFKGPATLVLGPSTAALIYDDPNGEDSYKESCGISDGVASCEAAIVYTGDYYGVFGGVNGYTISLYGTDVDYSVTTTIHWTETAQVYAVEGGSAVSVVTTTNAAGETLVVPTSAMSSSRSSGSSTPTSTTTAGSVSNGAGGTKHTSSASMVVGIVCAAAIIWLM